MKRVRRAVQLGALLLLVVAVTRGTGLVLGSQDGFPHQPHDRLFPFCEGCHVMDDGGRPAMYPPAALCGRCHDGTQAERVSWSPPSERPTLLRFEHVAHSTAAATEDPALSCESCHTRDSTVLRIETSGCLGCHAHPAAQDHFSDAECEVCHLPIARTNVPAEITLALSEPAYHQDPAFLTGHAQSITSTGTTCQYCHSRQQCASCHVNADRLAAIVELPVVPANVRLASIEARYPTPATHEAPDFSTVHGRNASPESCATCHTQESCTTCHIGRQPTLVAALPNAVPSGAQGVSMERAAPINHASPMFVTSHGVLATTDAGSCSTCHTTETCANCHSAPDRAVFHPPNYMMSHSSAAWAGRLECANCHDARAFCRDCHGGGGQVPEGRLLSPVFHDAEPLWLLRHGGAARRGLESCSSCHRQRDCLQCHSTLGAFRVSPHGSDFDARRAWQRNPIICKACHIGDPLAGGG